MNQIVLAATVLLSELVDSRELVNELQAYRTLRRHVTEQVIISSELDQIYLTRLNRYYKTFYWIGDAEVEV